MLAVSFLPSVADELPYTYTYKQKILSERNIVNILSSLTF